MPFEFGEVLGDLGDNGLVLLLDFEVELLDCLDFFRRGIFLGLCGL